MFLKERKRLVALGKVGLEREKKGKLPGFSRTKYFIPQGAYGEISPFLVNEYGAERDIERPRRWSRAA